MEKSAETEKNSMHTTAKIQYEADETTLPE